METTGSAMADETVVAASAVGGLMGFIMSSLAVVGVLAIAYYVLTVIARWKIFTKAGEAGWKSIVPIYNEFIEWKLSWTNINLFWAYLGLAIVGAVLTTIDAQSAAAAESGSLGFLGIVGIIVMLASAVLKLVQEYKLFQSFGKGLAWFIGYIFLNSIMILVLGFGSAEYEGPQD